MAETEGGWRIGTFAGAAVIVEPTILILAVYVLGSAVMAGGVSAAPAALIFLAALIVAVLIHEFAHAGVAWALKIPSKRIVLTFFGGYVQFAWPPKKRWHEIAVSAAGPLSNLLCAALVFAVLPRIDRAGDWSIATAFLDNFFYVSLFLGAFNLLPGHPLDGGQILRALLNYAMPRARARVVAGWCGLLVAAGLGAFALSQSMALTAVVALFLAFAAWTEIRDAQRTPPEAAF